MQTITQKRNAFNRLKQRQSFKNWRKAEFERLHGICPLCDLDMSMPKSGSNNSGRDDLATIDHIIPLIVGGKNELSNMRLICHSCNLHEEWERQKVTPLPKTVQNMPIKDIKILLGVL